MGNTLEQQPIFINHIEPGINPGGQDGTITQQSNGFIVEPTKTKKTKTFKNPTSLKKNSLALV
jgi:hypothetical protein